MTAKKRMTLREFMALVPKCGPWRYHLKGVQAGTIRNDAGYCPIVAVHERLRQDGHKAHTDLNRSAASVGRQVLGLRAKDAEYIVRAADKRANGNWHETPRALRRRFELLAKGGEA